MNSCHQASSPGVALEDHIFVAILKTADALSQEAEQLIKSAGLTMAQYNVLRILRGAGEQGLCCRELAERMITRDPDVTRLLDRLERRGLLARSRDSKDRRIITLRISAAGRRVLKDLDTPVAKHHRKQLSHMGQGDLRKLVELLEAARET